MRNLHWLSIALVTCAPWQAQAQVTSGTISMTMVS
jgi:hypothetical protein